jgi:exosortase/archaeosortase family protein
LLAIAALPLLKVDAFLVATLVGTKQSGNIVPFVDGSGTMQIWPACSSFHNISQAGLAWVALSQTLGRDLGLRDVFWGGLAITSAAAVNLARISMIAVWPKHFETIHGPFGAQIAGGLTIVLIAVICMIGQRRELFAPA